MGLWLFWQTCMEVSYCISRVGAIIRHCLCKLSIMFYRTVTLIHAWFSPHEKGNQCVKKLLGRISYKKIQRYNNAPPYVMARWLLRQIPSKISLARPKVYFAKNRLKLNFNPAFKCDFISLLEVQSNVVSFGIIIGCGTWGIKLKLHPNPGKRRGKKYNSASTL